MSTKNIILLAVGLAAAIALFLWGKSCGVGSVLKTVGTEKTVTKDSIVIKSVPFPVPHRVDKMIFVKGADGIPYPVYDTLWGNQEVLAVVDTAAILSRYYETAHYQHIVDTGRWKITVDESITQNRIKNWSLKAVSSDTTTVNTVQLKTPKKMILYFGIDYLGYQKTPFFAAGIDLALKIPNDKIFEAGVLIDKDGKLIYMGSLKLPIRLTKK